MRKFRRRYIAFKVSGGSVKREEVVKFFSSLFGGRLAGEFYLKLIFYDEGSGMGLLRCGHRHVEIVKKMISEAKIRGRDNGFIVIGVSGTIKSAKRKYFSADSSPPAGSK
jgi:RNase P/RNase MRP subunit POP5